eukprot:6264767-Pyramimonas_sp.AAC.2
MRTADAGAAWTRLTHTCTAQPLRAITIDSTSHTGFAVSGSVWDSLPTPSEPPPDPLLTPFSLSRGYPACDTNTRSLAPGTPEYRCRWEPITGGKRAYS